jgi:AcrR family transcriptional regulator
VALNKGDWIHAALEVLTTDGLSAVAVEPLARRLGATKGSFYWHFKDRAELVVAMLELWEQRETTDVIERIGVLWDPRERLVALGAGAYASAAGGNAYAGVAAAAADPLVGPVLERVTRARLAFLRQLYADLGMTATQATQLARLAYALYLGIAELRRIDPDGESSGDQLVAYLDQAVDIMFRPTER